MEQQMPQNTNTLGNLEKTLYFGTSSQMVGHILNNGHPPFMVDEYPTAVRNAVNQAKMDGSKPVVIIGHGLEAIFQGAGHDEISIYTPKGEWRYEQREVDQSMPLYHNYTPK
jgi:hypothetical protein